MGMNQGGCARSCCYGEHGVENGDKGEHGDNVKAVMIWTWGWPPWTTSDEVTWDVEDESAKGDHVCHLAA